MPANNPGSTVAVLEISSQNLRSTKKSEQQNWYIFPFGPGKKIACSNFHSNKLCHTGKKHFRPSEFLM